MYAQSVGADLLVSIHFNSSGPHDKFGSEVWTSLCSPYFDTGVSVGSSVLSHLTELGFANKGVKTRSGQNGDYYGIIRHGVSMGIPTIIVEHCFIDSIIDRALLEQVGTEQLAHADAKGLLEYIQSVEGKDAVKISRRHVIDSSDSFSSTSDSYVDEEYIRRSNEDRENNIRRNTPSVSHSLSESKLRNYDRDI